MTFFSLNSIIYSEFHSVFLDANTTKLEGRSSFHPASPCNLPPGKAVLRNECSSHNGLTRQPPFQMLQWHGPTCHAFFVSQVEATKKETEEELVSYSDYCRNSSKLGRSMNLSDFRCLEKPWMTSDDSLVRSVRHGAKWRRRTFKLSG